MKILVTGTAGFIGFHLIRKLLEKKVEIIGLDNINDYYDVELKFARLWECGIIKDDIIYNKKIRSTKSANYTFIKLNLEDKENLLKLFKEECFELVIHLAAQAGVEYSIINPQIFINSNITGFLNILEGCRYFGIKHLIYASSSSVYGLNNELPLSERSITNCPISIYGASKKCCELMAHTYSYLFNIPSTGLRIFSGYGPWGRPDMALFIFTKAILSNNPIILYNNGEMYRDFTYIDDIVTCITLIIEKIHNSSLSHTYKIYNIGNSSPVKLIDFIKALEDTLGKRAIIENAPIRAGDIIATWADVKDFYDDFNYQPNTDFRYGIKKFVEWYKEFYLK